MSKYETTTFPAALLVLTAVSVRAEDELAFTLHKLGPASGSGNTLLVVGGIQGDEPGGFNAAALLVTRYRITKGNVWVVPNLNFLSIVNRSRGVYGDMNRKFAALKMSDPEFATVQKIKNIILMIIKFFWTSVGHGVSWAIFRSKRMPLWRLLPATPCLPLSTATRDTGCITATGA